MIISFDLDGVLFVDPKICETEPPLIYPLSRLYPDRLRKGTVDLIHRLKEMKFQVWVYTSSYRRERYIKGIFWHYHVKFDRIINAARHERDDEEVVARNGKDYGFSVLLVSGPDPLWAERILAEANRLRDIQRSISKT